MSKPSYTIGYAPLYDDILANGYKEGQGFPIGYPATKIGWTTDLYGDNTNKFCGGGAVFLTAKHAAYYLVENTDSIDWSVYEIDADYMLDTYQANDGNFCRYLIKDVFITKKIGTISEILNNV